MKAAPFAYSRVSSIEAALRILEEGAASGEEVRVLSGGQSLVPMLAMRLCRPDRLVDINPVGGLAYVTSRGDRVIIGALARQQEVWLSPDVQGVPLLSLAIPWIGHRETRNRGTVCGSLAHADPSGEIPAIVALLDARVTVASASGVREVDGSAFVTGPFETTLKQTEIITAISFPVRGAGEGYGFREAARRRGDFATVGVAATVRKAPAGLIEARAVLFGVAAKPIVSDVTNLLRTLDGSLERAMVTGVSEEVVATVAFTEDIHASASYRKRLARALLANALSDALRSAA